MPNLLKKCPRCGEMKPIEEFRTEKSKKPYCRECVRNYNNETYAAKHPNMKKIISVSPVKWDGPGNDLKFAKSLPGSPWKKRI